jgi:hypothetical protein
MSFLSNHLHNPPSFISKWYQEVFPWYNSQRMYQTTYLQLLFGSRMCGVIYPHVISQLLWCGAYAQRHLYISLLENCSLFDNEEMVKSPKGSEENNAQNFPCTAFHFLKVSSDQCQAAQKHLSLAKLSWLQLATFM